MPRGRKKLTDGRTDTENLRSSDLFSSWRSARPDLDLTEFLLGVVMMRMGRLLEQDFSRRCRADFGISGADMRVLFALRRAGPPFARRPTDLFRALLVTSGAMTKQIDRLEEFGLVKRLPDPDYAGGFLIRLTRAGQAVADRATDDLAKKSLLGDALKAFDAGENEAIERLMTKLLQETEGAFNRAAGSAAPYRD